MKNEYSHKLDDFIFKEINNLSNPQILEFGVREGVSTKKFLDFCEKEKYKSEVLKFNPDYLFHIGAFTDLEYCEKNKDETIETNKNSVISAVEICNELKIPLLYISTAGIFDGQKEQYDETDTPNPIGVYASSKYEAEKYVIKNCEKYIIPSLSTLLRLVFFVNILS